MTKRFLLSGRAKKDLQQIKATSLKTWGEEKTKIYLTNIEERLMWLAANPHLGKTRDEVRQGLRSFPEGEHLVFYRITTDSIEIVGLPHQRQELSLFFNAM